MCPVSFCCVLFSFPSCVFYFSLTCFFSVCVLLDVVLLLQQRDAPMIHFIINCYYIHLIFSSIRSQIVPSQPVTPHCFGLKLVSRDYVWLFHVIVWYYNLLGSCAVTPASSCSAICSTAFTCMSCTFLETQWDHSALAHVSTSSPACPDLCHCYSVRHFTLHRTLCLSMWFHQ